MISGCTVLRQNLHGNVPSGKTVRLHMDLNLDEIQPEVPPLPPADKVPNDQPCEPSYPDVCLDPYALDYDCSNGTGNGPEYIAGPLTVLSPDPYDLDSDANGIGCEDY